MVVGGITASLLFLALAGLYREPVNPVRSPAPGRILRALALAVLTVTMGQSLLGTADPLRVAGAGAVALVAVILARYGFELWLQSGREDGRLRTRVVVAGSASETASIVEFLGVNPEAGLLPTAIVGDRPEHFDGHTFRTPWAGEIDKALEAIEITEADGLLVAVNGLPSETLNDLVHRASRAGVAVHLWNGISGVSNTRLVRTTVAHEPVTVLQPPRHGIAQRAGKRVLDVVLSFVLLVVSAPVLAIAAVLIWAHDRGPVFFRQIRVGKDGQPFTVLKLRTMEVDAESRVADLGDRNERHGPLFKVSDDPRVTPIGNFLRASALDEIPQLMSIVGPRPALPVETAQFDAELQRRHLVKPGATGLWQVEANHKASFDEYRRLDLYYVDNWSVGLDLSVIIDTVPAIVRRALRALRRPAPSAPVPVISPPPVPKAIEIGP
jgi:exopolysaccharide biosynthesis polyprenyl glycosylphosphotransferase